MSEFVDEFEAMGEVAANASAEEALVVAVDGFEGPLDLLLGLARSQKVDLAKISVLKLAEQYLEFVERARRLNLELAADYLVMAAWLAYLKSRLLLPAPPGTQEGEVSADEMAARLRWRLQRLDAMREAAARLMARDRLGREVFARGAPEPLNIVKLRTYSDSLYDLLTAYATQRLSKAKIKQLVRDQPGVEIRRFTPGFAINRIELGKTGRWCVNPPMRWLQTCHPTTLLIDQDHNLLAIRGAPQLLYQRTHLVWIIDIAAEENEPERTDIPKKGFFVGGQPIARTTIYGPGP